MISIIRAAVLLLIYTSLVSRAFAGLETVTGRGDGFWESHSIIIARVVKVRPLDLDQHPQETATHIVSLAPLLTAAGKFDPSRQSEVEARLAISLATSSIHELPHLGSIVLAVICVGNIEGDETRPFLWVIPDQCDFMPDRSALVPLGFDDKRIFQTLARVREARAGGKKEENGERG